MHQYSQISAKGDLSEEDKMISIKIALKEICIREEKIGNIGLVGLLHKIKTEFLNYI